jgi:antitoxin component of RelBE/YafQ-DinJ toxin-antitoxin module
MATLTVHGIDQSLKDEAAAILKAHGMTAAGAISAFLRSVVVEHKEGRCFCHDLEVNDLTRQAITDAEHGNMVSSHTDAADLFKHLKSQ